MEMTMKNMLFAAVAALTLAGSTAAFAGESNNPAGVQTTSQPIVASMVTASTGGDLYPAFVGGTVATGANVALNNGRGSEAEPEFAGRAAAVGTLAHAVAALPSGTAS